MSVELTCRCCDRVYEATRADLLAGPATYARCPPCRSVPPVPAEAAAVLAACAARGVELVAERDRITWSGKLTVELVKAIKRHEPQLAALLRESAARDP